MLGRVQSALFIDYENVGGLCPPEKIASWIAWLEDGEFDAGRKRKFVDKRIYWNPSALQHEKAFVDGGFKAILCEKFSRLKNGADIRIALDVAEAIIKSKRIKEFILFTKDTDFVPVLQRLRINERSSTVLVDESQAAVYATFRQHADVVIPVRLFRKAPDYTRTQPWAAAKKKLSGLLAAGAKRARPAALRKAPDLMQLAENHVIRVASLRPNEHTARKAIVADLCKIEGFTLTGQQAFCGKGSYKALMEELARRNDRIRVTKASGTGISVRYIVKAEEE